VSHGTYKTYRSHVSQKMTYEEAVAFWYGRIDYERRQPRPGDLKLDRMRALLRRLGDPHRRVRSVHIAGTKGKGSTSAILAAILRAAGHRTVTRRGYTSHGHEVEIACDAEVNDASAACER